MKITVANKEAFGDGPQYLTSYTRTQLVNADKIIKNFNQLIYK
jgi:hypothetical protein